MADNESTELTFLWQFVAILGYGLDNYFVLKGSTAMRKTNFLSLPSNMEMEGIVTFIAA